jgi:poly-gamma-glutamate capsule biosynthesis protein CapA/YwtB (metallophosphatase superfamily)
LVSPADFATLRAVAEHEPIASVPPPAPPAGEVRLLGEIYRADPSIDKRMAHSYRVEEQDRTALLASIAQARRESGFVLFSLHTHEAGFDETQPPDFAVKLAHDVIDAGADAVLAHGAHQLRGIEIYRGKPIFYSLANFAIMLPPPEVNTGPLVIPPGSLFTRRAFVESVVAVGRYRDGKLVEIVLHPLELSQTQQLDTHGLPQAAAAATAQSIIQRLGKLSEPFGTRIVFANGVGTIRVN